MLNSIALYQPFIQEINRHPGLKNALVMDDNGLSLKFNDKNLLDVNIQISEGFVGCYFSSGNSFEWFFKRKDIDFKDARKLFAQYLTNGARLERYYRNDVLTKTVLTIGNSRETYVKKIKLIGKRKKLVFTIPSPVDYLELGMSQTHNWKRDIQ